MGNLIQIYEIILSNLGHISYNIGSFPQIRQPNPGNIDQANLFAHSNIYLSAPIGKNQHGLKPFPGVKTKTRKRIETNFSQHSGQFPLDINHTKSFLDSVAGLLSKITAFTIVLHLNAFMLNRPVYKIKVNPA